MDSLTFVLKVLDAFVTIAEGLGIGLILAALWLLIRLLPERIRKIFTAFAASLLFFALLRENCYQLFVVANIRLTLFAIVSAGVLCLLIPAFSLLIAGIVRLESGVRAFYRVGDNSICASPPADLSARYFSSYLRRTTVLLQ